MTHLRNISLSVDEPDPGKYYWVLMESTEDASVWTELQVAELPFPTWNEAFEAGCLAMYNMVPDERIGPRTKGEDEDASPAG